MHGVNVLLRDRDHSWHDQGMFRLFLITVVLVARVAFSQTASYCERVASTLDPAEKFKPGASLFWSPAE
jgi:hypothetical protein